MGIFSLCLIVSINAGVTTYLMIKLQQQRKINKNIIDVLNEYAKIMLNSKYGKK